ncbi:MAG: hypothetical protein L0227_19040, partial [Chloroflexi bacterium]|nr:hypothetical protein [Chloroflexota bacterium]
MEARFRGAARATSLAAGVALISTLLLGLAFAPGPARGMGPLPACRYDDLLTSPRTYADWPITLVDTILRVPRTYVPPDLVDVSVADIPGEGR